MLVMVLEGTFPKTYEIETLGNVPQNYDFNVIMNYNFVEHKQVTLSHKFNKF